MLCRTNTLVHPGTGAKLATPLMVPSFSSKGFSRSSRVRRADRDGFRSLLHQTLVSVSEFIDRAYLISAFDISQGHLPPPTELGKSPDFVFVDSGGYEIGDYQDFSETEEAQAADEEWDIAHLRAVHDTWPGEVPAVLISFDHPRRRLPFKEQISVAQELFRGQDQHLHSFLLKPETQDSATLREVLRSVIAGVEQFSAFQIVGVTEWELGTSMLDRMVNIARLRNAMDGAGQQHIPLHIFGALDPLSTVLYFLSGAEIFDGLTWLRYAYAEARCIYRHNHAALTLALDTRDELARAQIMVSNYYYLRGLEGQLRDFCSTGAKDFEKLQPLDSQFRATGPNLAKFLTNAMDALNSKLAGK